MLEVRFGLAVCRLEVPRLGIGQFGRLQVSQVELGGRATRVALGPRGLQTDALVCILQRL